MAPVSISSNPWYPNRHKMVKIKWIGWLAYICGLSLVLQACVATTPTPTAALTNTPVSATITPPAAPTAVELTLLPTAAYREMLVFRDVERQTIRDIGSGNFIHYFGQAHTPFEPVSEMNWKTLAPKAVRVGMELDVWEPINDNDDPLEFAPDGFRDLAGEYNRATFEFLQKAQADGAILIASVWRVPDWLVENPNDDSAKIISRTLYPEAIESIAAWLLRARDEYGVTVDYFSFNEANLGIQVLLSPFDVIEMIKQAGPRFAELGLETKWLLGDTSNIAEAVMYSEWIWREESIRKYLGPFAYHSWDAGAADSTMQAIGKFADENELEVWCTEGGWNPSLWQQPEQFITWQHGRNLAQIYIRALKHTRTSMFMYWQMSGRDYLINDGSNAYPALTVIAEMQRQFPTGSVVVETGRDFGAINFTAVKVGPEIRLGIINNGLKENVVIRGMPDGDYILRVVNEKEGIRDVEMVRFVGGEAEIELPLFSLMFLLPKQ
jgi:O-glycosyl hydrolase